jgi:hypothetical protein
MVGKMASMAFDFAQVAPNSKQSGKKDEGGNQQTYYGFR